VTNAAPAARPLLIGIGNPLRGDDGVGWHLVGERGLCRHQLTPELAEALAAAERVLFVDAWLAPPGARPLLRPVPAAVRWGVDSHRLDPAGLMMLALRLFDRTAPAHELLVPAFDFSWRDPGQGEAGPPSAARFSAGLRRQLPQARQLLGQWLQGAAVDPCDA
jgi:hypothetical protein